MKKDWEKEFENVWKIFISKIENGENGLHLIDKDLIKSFISNLLAQKDKEHIEMTKELVAKKNKDCQRYLETQRTQLLEEFEKIVGEGIDDYFKGLIMIPNPQATKESLKQEIRDKLKTLTKD